MLRVAPAPSFYLRKWGLSRQQLAFLKRTGQAASLQEIRRPFRELRIDNRLLSQPAKHPLAIPETEDEAGDEANIVLKMHRRGGAAKGGSQVAGAGQRVPQYSRISKIHGIEHGTD